jgi:hypothetical protein
LGFAAPGPLTADANAALAAVAHQPPQVALVEVGTAGASRFELRSVVVSQ